MNSLLFFFLLKDYMDDSHGKEISLQYVTVKVPGQKPRGSRSTQQATTTVTVATPAVNGAVSSDPLNPGE